MKKVLITTKLLKVNEERISKIWNANLNVNGEIYSSKKLIELSEDCDAILSSILDNNVFFHSSLCSCHNPRAINKEITDINNR